MPTETGGPAPLDDAQVDLLARALEALEQHGDAGLDGFCEAHPDDAAGLRSQVDRLRELGLAGGPTAPAATPERLGPFRLLERLGGGGMGVVYRALQDGLERVVALKLVRPEQLYFPGARQRFQRELAVLARLQHPAIVPVHAGGEESGVPYLAMELVRGASLEEALGELRGRAPAELSGRDLAAAVAAVVARREGVPQTDQLSTPPPGADTSLFAGNWVTSCVRLARRLAQALEHAHGFGVVHRDIKPSNIMLTPDGRVLLLDFGLASAAGSARLTGSCQTLGSPAYMSPEQLRGDAGADGRCDLYSLGVTLYEALTLSQPFAAAGLELTRQRVLAARAPAPREANPAVTRDVETVLLTAMEADAERRYASATELAADLSNLLELRPVSARRTRWWLQLRRWTQRHPARAVGLAAAAVVLVGGPLAYALVTEQAARRIGAALEEARVQRQLAQSGFDRARRAVDELLTQVAEEQLLEVPHLEPLRRRLLESALRFHEELLAERGAAPGLRLDVATAGVRAATLLNELGRHTEALTAARRAAALAAQLAQAAPTDTDLLTLQGDALAAEAEALLQLGRPPEAADAATRLLDLRRRSLALEPGSTAVAFDVEAAIGLAGVIEGRAGRTQAAAALYAEQAGFAHELQTRASHDPVAELRALGSQVVALVNLADACIELDRVDDALAALQRAIDLSAPRLDALLETRAASRGAAVARVQLGRLRGRDGDPDEAEDLLRSGLEILTAWAPRAPHDVELARLTATGWNALGIVLMDLPDREADSRDCLLTSIEVQRRLVAAAPDAPLHVLQLAGSLINLAAGLRQGGDPATARPLLDEALTRLEALIAADSLQDESREAALLAAWHLGLTELDLADAEGAAAAAERLQRARPRDARAARIAAGLLARAADLAPATPDGRQRAAELLARALQALLSALDAGYADVHNLATAQDLTGLRGQPGFAELLERAEEDAARP